MDENRNVPQGCPFQNSAQLPLDRLLPILEGAVEFAVLFGSVASGKTHAESDVDIAVWPRAGADLDRLTAELAGALGTERLDVADLRRASGTLQQIVATRGVLLFEDRPGRFAQFAAIAERRWEDDRRRLPELIRATDLWLQRRGLA